MVKRQFVELVTGKAVEFAPEKTMQGGACETVVIRPGIIGRACSLRGLPSKEARLYLLRSQRLQAIVVRIAHIQSQAQFA